MGTENKKEKKEDILVLEEKYQQGFIGNNFNCTEAEAIPLFYLKFILAES